MGDAILASHGTSEKESGHKSTRNSGNLPDTQMMQMQRPAKSDDQVQSRVRFNVKNSVETCEPDAWVKQDRHHTVRTNGVGKTAEAPRKGTILSGGGRRAKISKQELVDCLQSRNVDGPSLVARRVYKIPHSELQITEIDVTGDGTVFNHGPRRNRSPSSSRNSEKDKAVGCESTAKGKTLELRSQDRVDSDTMSATSDGIRIRERFGAGDANLPKADNKRYRPVSQSDTSQTLNRQEVFVSHKWGKAADKVSKAADKDSKRIVQPRQVTNVQSLGNVYSATSNDENDAKDNSYENVKVGLNSHKRLLDDRERTNSPEVKTEETAPVSFDEAAKLAEWRKSMKAEVKALQNRGCWRVIKTPNGVRLIKSKFVFKLKRDWTGKVVKRKSRLVVLGC